MTGAEAMEIIGRLEALARPMTRRRIFTIANQLTLLRMLLIPAFVMLILYG